MSLSTHVLDGTRGRPAVGVRVRLDRVLPEGRGDGDATATVATAETDDDGRIRFGPGVELVAGSYRLVFDTGAYFAATATATFYPEVVITFRVADPAAHHHVPLLLSPFTYSTYRGS